MKDRKNIADWEKIISDCRNSGKPQRVYCREQGIPYSTFSCRRARIKKSSTPAGLVQVKASRKQPFTGHLLQIDAAFCSIRILGGVDETTLTTIFRSIKAAAI